MGLRSIAAAAVGAAVLAGPATAAPTITGFSPRSGPVDSRITITGHALKGARVRIGGAAAVHVRVNAAGTRVVAYVPPTTPLGPKTVTLTTSAGTARAAGTFRVEPVP